MQLEAAADPASVVAMPNLSPTALRAKRVALFETPSAAATPPSASSTCDQPRVAFPVVTPVIPNGLPVEDDAIGRATKTCLMNLDATDADLLELGSNIFVDALARASPTGNDHPPIVMYIMVGG